MKAVIQRVSNASVTVGGEVISSIGLGLCVLVGLCKDDTEKALEFILKSNKPSFHHAMPSSESELFYQKLLETLRTRYRPELVKDGKFGASMEVKIVNDGPVTIQIESPKSTTNCCPETKIEEAVVTEQKIPNCE